MYRSNRRNRTRLFDKLQRNNFIRTNKKPGLDSRGSSLIEVIVAMLVLALIILPMLDMFASAGRTNAKARSRQYANSVLENVLEELSAGNYELYEGVERSDYYDAWSRVKLYSDVPISGESLTDMTFYTAETSQGTRTYRAEVSFDASKYAGGTGLNNYAMPDINSYDTTNSEMIFLDSAIDDTIVGVFFDQYEMQISTEEQQRINTNYMQSEEYLFTYEREKWFEWWKALPENRDNPDAEPPEDYVPEETFDETKYYSDKLEPEEFRGYVRRDTMIEIGKVSEQEYTVRYTVRYSVDATTDELGLEHPLEAAPYSYSAGSGSRYTPEELKYLYIFYEPFSEEATNESLVLEATDISRKAAWNCSLYFAVQEGSVTAPLRFDVVTHPALTADERAERLTILADAGSINTTYCNPGKLVAERAAGDTVYQVTVRILEADTGEVVAQAETTLFRE